jgi:hypothetical protein
MKSKLSALYWRITRYAADGLTGTLRETYMTNARVLALVLGLDMEETQ